MRNVYTVETLKKRFPESNYMYYSHDGELKEDELYIVVAVENGDFKRKLVEVEELNFTVTCS